MIFKKASWEQIIKEMRDAYEVEHLPEIPYRELPDSMKNIKFEKRWITEEEMSHLDPGHQHTNASLRKLLGESGFIQRSGPARATMRESWTVWDRGTDRIWLVEYPDKAPEIRERDPGFKIIDPKTLGVRNPNIQNDGSPDE